jgi:hypothetical protein
MARGPIRLTREGNIPSIRRPGPGTLDHALRSIRGGKYAFMDLAPMAVTFEPRVARTVEIWSLLTAWQRRQVTLEALAAEAGLTPSEFLAAVVRAAFECTDAIANLLVACAFPGVVAASVKRARTPRGLADRQLLFEHMSAMAARVNDRGHPTNGKCDAEKTSSDPLAFLRKDPTDNRKTH